MIPLMLTGQIINLAEVKRIVVQQNGTSVIIFKDGEPVQLDTFDTQLLGGHMKALAESMYSDDEDDET